MRKMGAVIDMKHNLLVIGNILYDYGKVEEGKIQVWVAKETIVPAQGAAKVKLFVDGYQNGRLLVQDEIPFQSIGMPTEEAFIWVEDGVAYARIDNQNDTNYKLKQDAVIMSVLLNYDEEEVKNLGQVQIGSKTNQQVRQQAIKLLKKYQDDFKNLLQDKDAEAETMHKIHLEENSFSDSC